MRTSYPFFRDKADSYIFSALCIKSHLYKNPALSLTEDELADMIVDGAYDGGVDAILANPSSDEACDLVIAQSKFYSTISFDDAMNALIKMASFYKDMKKCHFENVSEKVQRRFLALDTEMGDESRVIFILFTSAPQNKIDTARLENRFKEQFSDTSNIELNILFDSDIALETKEAESKRPTVEFVKIRIDRAGNILKYDADAVIVNASALSIKTLYAMHGTNLLARNLRYHIKSGREIDKAIENTINSDPNSFWLRNNGITIICDSFSVDGKEVKLRNFSVINVGQTVYILHKSKNLDENSDFFLPCKIILVQGNTIDEKNLYILEIAKAVNSQKPIRDIDLKANAPEQVRFVQTMRAEGIFYQTKRGEIVPREYKTKYLNTNLAEVGKLCLCAIFQIPGVSRSKPSSMYKPKYYDVMFNREQAKTARICMELLYIDYFFREVFIKKYDKDHKGTGRAAQDSISFAHNARTACIAFTALASRYRQGNITDQHIDDMASAQSGSDIYDKFRNIDSIKYIFPDSVFLQKDQCDDLLVRLFTVIINSGITVYKITKDYEPAVTAANFLKIDKNYYKIISIQWLQMKPEIDTIFDDFGM